MEDNTDEPFNINRDELSTPSLRKVNDTNNLKNIIIIAGAVALMLVILIIIIVLATKKSDSNEKSKNKIGELVCIFDTSSQTRILSDDFKTQDIEIYVDGTKIKFSREYKFPTFGIHHVNFHIFSDLNMDYMFKNIPEIVSVEMISDKKAKISSMTGAFDKAENRRI